MAGTLINEFLLHLVQPLQSHTPKQKHSLDVLADKAKDSEGHRKDRKGQKDTKERPKRGKEKDRNR
jgi:hypothetical protein